MHDEGQEEAMRDEGREEATQAAAAVARVGPAAAPRGSVPLAPGPEPLKTRPAPAPSRSLNPTQGTAMTNACCSCHSDRGLQLNQESTPEMPKWLDPLRKKK